MTRTHTANEIKAMLKAKLGLKPSQYSLRWDSASMCTSLDCRVKDPTVGLSALSEALDQFESIRRCERTGDILGGGNTYVSVSYKWDMFDEQKRKDLREDLKNRWEGFLFSPANNYGASCWNPFCPKELWAKFCESAGQDLGYHSDFIASCFGGLPHRCDPVVAKYYQQEAA